MAKKAPLRMCTGCRELKNKKDLIRVVKTPESEVAIDISGKTNGRGAYICPHNSCLQKAIRSRSIERSLKIQIPEDLIESLEKEMNLLES